MSHIGNFNVNFNNAFYVAQQLKNVQAIQNIMLIEKMIYAFSYSAQVDGRATAQVTGVAVGLHSCEWSIHEVQEQHMKD